MGVSRVKDVKAVSRVDSSPPRPVGHSHFWERALSRRQMLGTTAGAAALVVGGSLFRSAWAGSSDPKPIPGGLSAGGQGWHLFPPGRLAPVEALPILEPSTIYDFNGVVAVHEVQGTGVGRQGGIDGIPLAFDTDMRIMRGRYIGLDDRFHTGTFGFI